MFGFTRIPSITTTTLAQRLQQHLGQLIDVREPTEYRAGHIAGAKNVPLSRIDQYTPKNSGDLYVICRSGARSKRAAKALSKRGIAVTNVAGGMLAWTGRTVK